MAISLLTSSASNVTPGSNSYSVNFNSGGSASDKAMYAVVAMANTVNFSSASYGGTSMTSKVQRNFGGLSQRLAIYELTNVADGVNQFTINFTGNQWNPISIGLYSLSGVSSSLLTVNTGGQSTPNSNTVTGSSSSWALTVGIAVNALGSFTAGSRTAAPYQHNTNKQVGSLLSNGVVGSTSISYVTRANFGNITNTSLEILEASAPPAPSSSGWYSVW